MSTPGAPTGFCNVYGAFPWIQLGTFKVTFQLWGVGPSADAVRVNTVAALLVDGILCDCANTPSNPLQYVQLIQNESTTGRSYWTVECPILSAQQLPFTLTSETFDLSTVIQPT